MRSPAVAAAGCGESGQGLPQVYADADTKAGRGGGTELRVDSQALRSPYLCVLLDLNDGSLLFFKNGAKHGPGYPAGSVTGPVAAAVQTCYIDDDNGEAHAVRLLPDAEWPAGHSL